MSEDESEIMIVTTNVKVSGCGYNDATVIGTILVFLPSGLLLMSPNMHSDRLGLIGYSVV